jgi:large subunit ribosomal protein L19e
MKLDKKKQLAARVLGVGKERIFFNPSRLEEIAEAITRQDFRDLLQSKAILIKVSGGRRKKEKRKRARGFGKIRKKIKKSKRAYITITRKLRLYIQELLKQEKITPEEYTRLRKQIRTRIFKSKSHLQNFLQK